jgi:hypothetical protein
MKATKVSFHIFILIFAVTPSITWLTGENYQNFFKVMINFHKDFI